MTTQENLKVSLKTFDADTAKEWLEKYNTDNYRKHCKVRSSNYAKLMKEGKWLTSASTISISSDGVLINGQHRLQAIVKAGVDVDIIVIENAAPSSVYVVDTHKPRTMKDHLKCSGYLITSVNVLLRAVGLRSSAASAPDLDFYRSHVDGKLGRFSSQMHDIHKSTSDPFTSWGVRGALIVAVLNGEITQKYAVSLFGKLCLLRKYKTKTGEMRHVSPASVRADVLKDLPPLLSTLVDKLDAGLLPAWSDGAYRDGIYKSSTDKPQKLMLLMGQCLSRETKDLTKFSKPCEVSVRKALGL